MAGTGGGASGYLAGTVARAAGSGAGRRGDHLQAAYTGLTGGSTPDGDDYGRPIVLVSTLRLTGIQLLNEGARCCACRVPRWTAWSRRWPRWVANRIR